MNKPDDDAERTRELAAIDSIARILAGFTPDRARAIGRALDALHFSRLDDPPPDGFPFTHYDGVPGQPIRPAIVRPSKLRPVR